MSAAATIAALALLPGTVRAAGAGSSHAMPGKACHFSPVAGVRDDRPPPLIRQRPWATAAAIGRIVPEPVARGDAARGVAISVDRVAGSWVHVEASPADARLGRAATPAGWLALKDIYFVMQTSKGFARPDARSALRYAIDDWVYPALVLGIEDCHGEWLKLVVASDEESDPDAPVEAPAISAWFRGFCGQAETTCDGTVSD